MAPVKDRSHSYVSKVREELEGMGCEIKTSCEIKSVSSIDGGTANSRSFIDFFSFDSYNYLDG
jgi:cyclopropane-fatty-acyl-phospholipid synthase